jgi:drug/metabolite transporter (DMT)-like permease
MDSISKLPSMNARSNLPALLAIGLWATLAPIGSLLSDLPPFFLTGIGLLVGSVLALFMGLRVREALAIPPRTLAVGVFGLFGFHAALFTALQMAPAVQANLVNYLWPLLLVVIAPLFLKGTSLTLRHVIAALVGFAGAALAITSGGELTGTGSWGYFFAFLAAVIWATYSLLTKRLPHFDTALVGVFALVSGVLSLIAHLLIEQPVSPSAWEWLLLVLMGLGPLGGAFYLWDYALKNGDPQRIGLLSFLTPLLSTTLLLLVTGKPLTLQLLLAGVLIIGAAILGSRVKNNQDV